MAKKTTPFNNPFATVGKAMKRDLERETSDKKGTRAPRTSTAETPEHKREVDSGEEPDFAAVMGETARLAPDPRGRSRPPLPPTTAAHVPLYDEDSEVYEELLDLVEGRSHFNMEDSDEFIEGCVEGLDRRVLAKLRRGEFAIRAHLDLHGLTRDLAKEAVEHFLREKQAEGFRTVLIVHGRGLNSKDQIPVLKVLLRSWLERGRIAKTVLAFATAKPHDGGAGALYVLLRRQHPRGHIP